MPLETNREAPYYEIVPQGHFPVLSVNNTFADANGNIHINTGDNAPNRTGKNGIDTTESGYVKLGGRLTQARTLIGSQDEVNDCIVQLDKGADRASTYIGAYANYYDTLAAFETIVQSTQATSKILLSKGMEEWRQEMRIDNNFNFYKVNNSKSRLELNKNLGTQYFGENVENVLNNYLKMTENQVVVLNSGNTSTEQNYVLELDNQTGYIDLRANNYIGLRIQGYEAKLGDTRTLPVGNGTAVTVNDDLAKVISHSKYGRYQFDTVSEYTDNNTAKAGGLTTGMIYRTGDLLKIVH